MIKVLLAASALLATTVTAQGQQPVPCWQVPNGVYNTIQCANGFWTTITPEGEVFTGNGLTDPNAHAQGSSIVIDGPRLGPQVTPPPSILPTVEPYQAQQFGYPPRQD